MAMKYGILNNEIPISLKALCCNNLNAKNFIIYPFSRKYNKSYKRRYGNFIFSKIFIMSFFTLFYLSLHFISKQYVDRVFELKYNEICLRNMAEGGNGLNNGEESFKYREGKSKREIEKEEKEKEKKEKKEKGGIWKIFTKGRKKKEKKEEEERKRKEKEEEEKKEEEERKRKEKEEEEKKQKEERGNEDDKKKLMEKSEQYKNFQEKFITRREIYNEWRSLTLEFSSKLEDQEKGENSKSFEEVHKRWKNKLKKKKKELDKIRFSSETTIQDMKEKSNKLFEELKKEFETFLKDATSGNEEPKVSPE